MLSNLSTGQVSVKVRSAKQKDASRANGKLAKGAVTNEGKLRSSMNALKHGGYAERFVPVGQNVDAYQEYFDRQYAYWKPTDALEEEFVHQLIRYGWKLQFNAILESSLYSNEILNYYRSNLSLDYRKTRNISKVYLVDNAKSELNKSDELTAIAFQQDLNGNQCLLALDDMDSRVFAKFQKTLDKLLEHRRRKDELQQKTL
jgi:hypothetical protein